MPLIVLQDRGACSFRHVRRQRDTVVAFLTDVGIGCFFGCRRFGVGIFLQQTLVGGQQRVYLAAALLDTGVHGVFHVLQRRVAFSRSLRIVVGNQDQSIAI